MRILVSGAGGFVGRHLTDTLRARGHEVRAAGRASVGDIGPQTDWSGALDGIEVVVHLAARAHILKENAADPRAAFMRTNAQGTARLAQAAAAGGVRRMLYLSTIGVHGNATAGEPFTERSPLAPHNLYAESKLAGEIATVAPSGGVPEIVIVRPPLVYGTGVSANFLRILRLVDRGVPLPFASVHNQRSLVSVWNLTDLLATLCEQPLAPHSVFVVSDGEDLSTAQLVRRLARLLGRSARLLPVPPAALRALGTLTGRRAEVESLCGSLVVDSSGTRARLKWSPPLSVDEGLERTVRAYRKEADAAR